MDFKQFEYIIKVAEMKNITRAANELYISQPSLSHFITKVEEELGELLFDRSTNPISLTLAGEKFVETGKRIIEMNKDLKDEIFEISSSKKGRIRLGIPRTRATYMLPLFYPDFHEKYPNIEIKTKEMSSTMVEEQVLKGQVDFGIMPMPIYENKQSKLLDYELIGREQIVIVVKKGYLSQECLIDDKFVSIKALGDIPFIFLNKGRGMRSATDNMFYNKGIKPKILMETSSNGTAMRMASAGIGAAIVPAYMTDLFKGVYDVDVFSLSEERVYWDIAFICQKNDEKNEMRDELVRILKDRFY